MTSLCNFGLPVLAFSVTITLPPVPQLPVFKIPSIPGLTLNLQIPQLKFPTVSLPSAPRLPVLKVPTIPGLSLNVKVPTLAFPVPKLPPIPPRLPVFLLPPCPLDGAKS